MRAFLRVLIINLGVVVGLLVVGLCLVELFFRLNAQPGSIDFSQRYAEDPVMNHVFTPNFQMDLFVHPEVPTYKFQTNELGLRYNEPYDIEKPANTIRLLVTGDSFVEGYEWDKTIPARVQRALDPWAAKRGVKLQVIHAGVGTYSPTVHYFAFKTKLLRLNPDAVVLAIDMTDAFDDAVRYPELVYYDDRGEPAGVRSDMAQRKLMLRKGMAEKLPFSSFDGWVARLAGASRTAELIFERRVTAYLQKYEKLGDYIVPNPFALPMFDAKHPETRKWIEKSLEWIARIHDLLKARNIPLFIVMYPYQPQLQRPELQAYFDVYAEWCAKRGIFFHSTVPAFATYQNERRTAELYLSGDTHFNYKGQEIWANSLIAALKSNMPAFLPALAVTSSVATSTVP